MPLYQKERFVKEPTPSGVKLDDEVFYCPQTDEIFTDYEKFYSRIILCNALVWSCSYSGKSGLTYAEAEDNERKCLDTLQAMNTILKRSMIYLVTLTHRQRFSEVVEDVYSFVKDRYFINEAVYLLSQNTKKKCKIISVRAPTSNPIKLDDSQSKSNGLSSEDAIVISDEDEEKLADHSKSSESKKEFKSLPPRKYKYEIQEEGAKKTHFVRYDRLCRPKSEFSREKLKLVLKCNCESKTTGIWIVKDNSRKEYEIDTLSWLDLFDGPYPHFALPVDKIEKKKIKSKKVEDMSLSELKEHLSMKEKRMQEIKMNKEQLRDMQMQKRLQAKNERLEREQWLRDWAKPREDLQCEDLEPLPISREIILPHNIPSDFIGDIFSLVSCCILFGDMLDIKNSLSEKVTVESLCRALTVTEVDGLYSEILVMFLGHLLTLHDDDNLEDVNENIKSYESEDEYMFNDKTSDYELIATKRGTKLALLRYNHSIQSLQLDAFTVSEILRLHLLSSGCGDKTDQDACLRLKKSYPNILRSLLEKNITEFSLEVKLKVLVALSEQLLDAFRDVIDEKIQNIREMQAELVQLKKLYLRRERSETAYKMEIAKQASDNSENADKNSEKSGESQENSQKDSPQVKRSTRARGGKKEDKEIKSVAYLLDQTPEEIDWSRITDETKTAMNKAHNALVEELQTKIFNLQSIVNLRPIGYDRTFRKYWYIPYVSGILVEDDGCPDMQESTFSVVEQIGPPPEIKKQREQLLKTKLADEVALVNEDEKNTIEIDSEPLKTITVAESIKNRGKIRWSYYSTKKEITSLISLLSTRGVKEHALKNCLLRIKDYVINNLSSKNCWNPEDSKKSEEEPMEVNEEKSDKSEICLRDMILDLEDRLYVSQLGNLKVRDRDIWRSKILKKSYDVQASSLAWHKCNENSDLVTRLIKDEESSRVKILAASILQLGQAIEKRFLQRPLGDKDENRLKKQKALLEATFKGTVDSALIEQNGEIELGLPFERWEYHLMQATSLAQLFVCIAILDSSVIWEKSVLHTRCKICRRKGGADQMLLCDGCDRGHHTYCLKPPVKKIPEGNWYCQACKPKDISPRKGKSRVVLETDEEEESEEENDSMNSSATNKTEENEDESSDSESRTSPPVMKIKSIGSKRKLRNRSSLPASREGTPKEMSNRRSNRNNKNNEIQRSSSTRSKQQQTSSTDNKKAKPKNNKKSESTNESTNELRGGRKRKRTTNETNDQDTQQAKRQKVEGGRTKRGGRRSLKKIEELVNEFALHEDAWPFLKPVSKKAVPDYYEFITNPMDVRTIKAKMNRLEYNDSQQIIEDLRLMLKNCFQYNVTKAEVYKCGKIMEKWLNERLKETELA
ncbi:DgyrCDS9756 [Dimorphilus gyrociliatus]|uniref:Bromodomain adjacent to zinc finger domain protein 1A n=1 Tax=Dimorphilus gyrociliatus TaxID=2664684 RepID=A0A7I8VZ75_9ANNE|nr:DgyrCDS9756 [Dimorphilus gyrociliatus]